MWPARSGSSRRATGIKGKNAEAIDDVITAGATAEACARVLKLAKAARVVVSPLATAGERTSIVI